MGNNNEEPKREPTEEEVQILNDVTNSTIELVRYFYPSSTINKQNQLRVGLHDYIDFRYKHPPVSIEIDLNNMIIGYDKVNDCIYPCVEIKFELSTPKKIPDKAFQAYMDYIVGMFGEYSNALIKDREYRYYAHVQPTGNNFDEPFATLWNKDNFEDKNVDYIKNALAISISLIPK